MSAVMQSIRGLGQVRLATMIAAATVLIGLFIFLALRFSAPALTPLYTNLPVEDSGQIVAELDKMGVPYELRAGGTQILAPSDQVLRLRLSLAQQGMPSGGSVVGYEIFDRAEALGTSNFVLNVNMLRALEGELARTIASLTQVETARVHLVVPKRELFAREQNSPTASVALKMRGGYELDRGQIASITHLIATAVPGLKPSAITIVDSKGRLLSKGGSDNKEEVAASDAMEYRVAYENRMRDAVESLLGQSLGPGKVRVRVAADMDFDRVVINSEKYDPEGQVVRSTQSGGETESSTEGAGPDNVSVANNLPGGAAAGGAGGENATAREQTNETTNYEISKVVESHVKEVGGVKKLSIAVLVDGTYTTDAEGNSTYAPRSDEEIQKIETLVKSAVGFDEERGDSIQVVNMRFNSADEALEEASSFGWLMTDMQGIIRTLVVGGVAILAILLIIRPIVNRAIEAAALPRPLSGPQALEMLEAPGGGGGGEMARLPGRGASALSAADSAEEDETLVNIERIQGKIKSSAVKKINDIVEKNPDESLTVIRQWVLRES